jgi:WD40 repeat protein
VLDVFWSKDGSKLFSGGVDKAAKMFDLNTGQSQQVGAHDAPIKCVRWVEAPTGGILATGSWDKTVKVCYLFCSFVSIHKTTDIWIVLGFENSKSYRFFDNGRANLYDGYPVSSYGCWDGRATYPDRQLELAYCHFQGRLW